MPAGVSHYPDPDITYGPYRVLPRTDGGHVVVDLRLPLGKRTVRRFRTLAGARECAQNLWVLSGQQPFEE